MLSTYLTCESHVVRRQTVDHQWLVVYRFDMGRLDFRRSHMDEVIGTFSIEAVLKDRYTNWAS